MSDAEEPASVNRRRWLTGAAVAGVAVAGGAIGGGVAAAADDSGGGISREPLVLDVACDGATFREQTFPDPPDPGDRRGSPFAVEGWIYPAGTVNDGFLVTEDGAIGRWFCNGFNILSAERPEPHINATADFVLGTISEERVFPPDGIVTHGLGGTFDDTQASTVVIVGGTGEYLGVLGAATRQNVGRNNTVLFGPEVPAPNFRYEFDLIRVT